MSSEMAVAQTQEYQIRPYADKDSFELAQRMAASLTHSTLVPPEFQGERGLGNCLIAMEMAGRMRISPFMCMQSLYVVHGRPSWSAQFVISLVNSSGRFKGNLKYRYSDDGSACTAWAVDAETGETLEGETITVEMAKKAGWFEKGSQLWKTAPRQMLAYRAATFFARLHCPDIILGMYTREEVIDTYAEEGGARPGGDSTGRAAAIAGDILGGLDAAGPVPAAPVIDAELKQAEPTTVPEATKQTAPIPVPASAAPKQAEPAAPAEPAQGLSASDQPVPPAHPTVARKIYNKYLDFFSGDKGEAKRAMDKVTGGKPSKDWTIPTVMSLESRLAELERERAAKDMGGVAFSEAEIETLMGTVPLTPAPKPAGVGAGEIKAPMPADAKETGFPPTVEPIDADEARRIAEEEAAAFL